MEYKESKLFKPLKKYLDTKGFKVYSEIPLFQRSIDIVAEKEGIIKTYELKTGFSNRVFSQAYMNSRVVHKSFAVASTSPSKKSIELGKKYGVGILQIKDGIVIEILDANFNKNISISHIKNFHLELREEANISGLPCILGEGPAKETLKHIKKYLEEKPNVTWKELFENIPNHYQSASSLASSMRQWCKFSLSEFRKRLL